MSDADAIVIGSGFGGAVLAARLSQAGLRVVVLERGRRWPPGSFPRSDDLKDGWLWGSGAGLYDIRWLDRMLSVQAAGWGGGSLVYANVFARPYDPSLSPRWPPHLRRSALDPYYDLAAHMVGVAPVAVDPATGAAPARTLLMEDLVARLGRSAGTIRPLLAVRFQQDPDAVETNRHGVHQRGCSFVGECVIGCNRGAKNSLDHTYLAVAERAGATAVPHAEVERIEPAGDGYAVSWRDPRPGGDGGGTLTAPRVFVAAGAVGSTELLLRQRDVLGTLPALPARLGDGFSGNGDYLATTRVPGAGDLTRGPTITTTTILDVPEGGKPVWFQVQDGAIPLPLQFLVGATLPLRRVREAWARRREITPDERMALLTMGHDSATGRLTLDDSGSAVVAWDNRREARLYRAEGRVNPLLRRMLGSPVHAAPTWTLLRRAVTVHNLGGVPAGPDGVVDEWGEVHRYPGLFVVDGSTLPGATGVNPSATILAAAERSAEHLVRRLSADPGWRAPEWPDVVPAPIPEDVAGAAMASLHARTSGDGVGFRERMQTPRGAGMGPAADLRLEVSFEGFDAFSADPSHPLEVTGTLSIAGVADHRPLRGTLSLFPDGSDLAMRYVLDFTDDGGAERTLVGEKAFLGRGPLARWHGVTRLRWQLDGAPAVRGVVAIGAGAVAALLASIRGEGFTLSRRASVLRRFGLSFAARALRRAPRA
ncbi:GMC oxidoreductase [Microbacterium sp. RD1]|uniref:GMC oxidoreductase n=1 Tax=Microbacterium sp. RD1 TaxID=3457313 RepID=UPI003FA601D4